MPRTWCVRYGLAALSVGYDRAGWFWFQSADLIAIAIAIVIVIVIVWLAYLLLGIFAVFFVFLKVYSHLIITRCLFVYLDIFICISLFVVCLPVFI